MLSKTDDHPSPLSRQLGAGDDEEIAMRTSLFVRPVIEGGRYRLTFNQAQFSYCSLTK